ncbi:MAG TPA: alanine--tRNA ligase [Tepidisphaeraceae bacterium]|jgi:alanyl-tRNA synthetase|nr:alanine--tRNA ligase [Tepidisphaeraceae bacterium]
MTSQEIRQQFIDFFVKKHGHTFVPSSPVVPLDDPTLLFSNAGMNQFKPIFLGAEKREYNRAANSQKCIRAGGKHNDLDDVGKDTYHHTFFEMLGNWSFGDYFKREAIEWAWDLLTNIWKLDKSRLHATVFMGDAPEGLEADREAQELWRSVTDIDPNHVHLGNKKDNFWEMGESGPCGPCSEIHIDLTPDKSGALLVNSGDARVMEIWNLVFIQFNRGTDGRLTPLPAKHVDTGMGFERVCSVIQKTGSNYDTDVFRPLMDAIADLSKQHYTRRLDNPIDIAFRVIADHTRMSTFAITDGARPGNKKRDAVVRSVIRRAVRFGYQVMNFREPFLYRLVPVVAQQMGDAFPELRRDPNKVSGIIKEEEANFFATVERGLRVFDDAAKAAATSGGIIAAKPAFDLHQELGFPIDLTTQLAQERGLTVDMDGYTRLWEGHIRTSGEGRKQHMQVAVDLGGFKKTDDSLKYQGLTTEATILGWVSGSDAVHRGSLRNEQEAALLLDQTTFYAEQGGQVADVGTIQTSTGQFDVTFTERKGEHVLHWGAVAEGSIEAGQRAMVKVDSRRSDIMRNHTATHLLNWALRKVLGDHIEQKGSLVDGEKLRFDFSHDKPVTAAEMMQVERLVNEKIYSDLPVSATIMPLNDAKKLPGVRAVFGEKYPDPVRVIAIGVDDPRKSVTVENSIEFCGGTHLRHTGEAGFMKIVSEENVSKGVRRLTAVTGRGAVEFVHKMEMSLRGVSQALSSSPDEAPRRIAALQEEIKSLKKKLASGAGAKVDPSTAAAKLLADAPALGSAKLIVGEIAGANDEQLRGAMDSLKKKAPSHAIMLGAAEEEKVSFVAAVSDDIIARGLKAGDWIRETAKVAGGGGGGRPQMAQAGGKDPAKLPDALERARRYATETVK